MSRGALLFASLIALVGACSRQSPAEPRDSTTLSVAELVRRQPEHAWWYGKLVPLVAEMQRRAQSGAMSDEEWRDALTASSVLVTRSRWPSGTPLQVGIRIPPWLFRSEVTVAAIQPDLGAVSVDDRVPQDCGTCQELRDARAMHLSLATVPAAMSSVTFEVSVRQVEDPESPSADPEKTRLLWRGRLERDIHAVASVADLVPGTDSEAERRAIRRAVRAWWSSQGLDASGLSIASSVNYSDEPLLRGLGISLSVELWEEGNRIRSTKLVAYPEGNRVGTAVTGMNGFVFLESLSSNRPGAAIDIASSELRIRGDPTDVPGIWDAERWWNGSFSMPLAEALEAGTR